MVDEAAILRVLDYHRNHMVKCWAANQARTVRRPPLRLGCLTVLSSAISQRHRNRMVKCWHVEGTSTAVWQPRDFASKSESSQSNAPIDFFATVRDPKSTNLL
jgi:hypothetical protein